MNHRVFRRPTSELGLAIVIFDLLLLSSGLLAAQVTISAGPPPLYEVKTIYIASPYDDFVRLLRSRLEERGAVSTTSRMEDADAILTCETGSTIIPAKVVVRRIDAQVRLVDRGSHKLIWSTKKSSAWEGRLADEIVDQFKKDRQLSLANR